LKVNREIRAPKVRLISHTGEQVGIVSIYEAMSMAEAEGLDLVEIVPGSTPPVCKVMNFGKFRYDQSKKEKESKKAAHQIKVKEVKLKPNIDEHDLHTKIKHARDFILHGDKVKVTCVFRGREMVHPEIGEKIMREFCQSLEDISIAESPPKMMGRTLLVILAPGVKKRKESAPRSSAQQIEGSAQEQSESL
jgi:translation initiation factor IF-3